LKEQNCIEEAITSYRRAISINPDFAEAHCNLGVLFKELGKLDEAAASHYKALAIKPDYAEAHNNLGTVQQDQGLLDEALASHHKAFAIKPDFAEAHANLGNIYQELGKLDEAAASYHRALAIKPDYAEAHSNLGNTFQELGKLDEAVVSHYKALAIKPDYAEALNNLGTVLQNQGLLDEAVVSYHKALAIKPDYAEAWTNIGTAYTKLGRLDDAVSKYQKLINLKHDNADAWNGLNLSGEALFLSKGEKDNSKGVRYKELNDRALATNNFAIHNLLLSSSRPHEADKVFQQVIDLLPDMALQKILINEACNEDSESFHKPDKVVALLHFGRSGTGLLHSLIDSHPEISTLPSVYLRGYFNEGVWERLSSDGWQGLAKRFCDEFAVLFDARTPKPIPSRLGEASYYIGENEGMTCVGDNRDQFLSLNKDLFCQAVLRLMEGFEAIDPMSFLLVVHSAFDGLIRSPEELGTNKRLCFYHIHNPDHYAMANFLRYNPNAHLLMTVREPIPTCEAVNQKSFDANDYDKCALSLIELLFGIDQIPFRKTNSIGIRLEDIKNNPEESLRALCVWMDVEYSTNLNEMTAQGNKWWGDPSSPDYSDVMEMLPFDDKSTKRPLGTILDEKDQFILGTLFYPFSVRFDYRESDPKQFRKDLIQVRLLLDDMLDFEVTIADRLNISHNQFKKNGIYILFHARLIKRWNVLNELGEYPYMLKPLRIM
jgi:tetratricopeptide (TPR) repeat protein